MQCIYQQSIGERSSIIRSFSSLNSLSKHLLRHHFAWRWIHYSTLLCQPLLLHGVRHQFLFSAFRAHDILSVSNKPLSNHRRLHSTQSINQYILKLNIIRKKGYNISKYFEIKPIDCEFLARCADKAIVVPVAAFEGNKPSSSNTYTPVSNCKQIIHACFVADING